MELMLPGEATWVRPKLMGKHGKTMENNEKLSFSP
jgi:hypothetical protein